MADIESGWDRVGSLKKKVLIKYRIKKRSWKYDREQEEVKDV